MIFGSIGLSQRPRRRRSRQQTRQAEFGVDQLCRALRRSLIKRGVPEAWLRRLPDDLYGWLRDRGVSDAFLETYLPRPLPLPLPDEWLACALANLPPQDTDENEDEDPRNWRLPAGRPAHSPQPVSG